MATNLATNTQKEVTITVTVTIQNVISYTTVQVETK